MPYQEKRMTRISAGETDHTFPGAINFTYESETDDIAAMFVPGRIALPAPQVAYDLLRVIEPYPDQYNLTFPVVVAKVLITPPLVQYQIMAERSLTFTTSGGPIDNVPYPESEVGMFVNYSLNSPVVDVAPPGAHQGIEYVEAQLGQIEINWGRAVAPGQTIRVWTQLRDSIPTP